MNSRPILIATCVAIAIVVVVYFAGKSVFETEHRKGAPLTTSISKPTTSKTPTENTPYHPTTNTNDKQETSVTEQPAPPVDNEATTYTTEADKPKINKAETETEPVSPHGFGPYPEIPADYPDNPLWSQLSRNHELMHRMRIKLWNQGRKVDAATISSDGSRMYPLEPYIVYVRWKEFVEDDGTISRYASRTKAHGSIPDSDLDQIEEGIIPPGYTILSIDDDYINPIEFLNLK